MFASPHAPATGRRPCASSEDVGGLVDLVKDVVGQGVDVVVGVADIVSDWTGLPVDDVVRELVDLVEDNAPVVVAEFRRYAAAKLQDPEFWAQLAGHLTALVATGGASAIVDAPLLTVAIARSVAARGMAYGSAQALDAAGEHRRAEANRAYIRGKSDGQMERLANDMMDASGAFNQRVTEVHGMVTSHRKWRELVAALESMANVRAALAEAVRARQAEIRSWFDEGQRRIEATGYRHWGPTDEHMPLQEYVLRRQAGDGPAAAYFHSVPAAVQTVARQAIRSRFPALRRFPSSLRAAATRFVAAGGMVDPEPALAAVASSLEAARARVVDPAVSARADVHTPGVQGGARVEAPARGPSDAVSTAKADTSKTSFEARVQGGGSTPPRVTAPPPSSGPAASPPRAEPPPSATPPRGAGGVLILAGVLAVAVMASRRRVA